MLLEVTQQSIGGSDNVEIYADVVYASGVIVAPPSCRSIAIWARVLFPGVAIVKLQLGASAALLRLFTGLSHPNISFEFKLPGKTRQQTLGFPQGIPRVGVKTTLENVEVLARIDPPAYRFEYASITDQFDDAGLSKQVEGDAANE